MGRPPWSLVRPAGFEPATFGFGGQRSNPAELRARTASASIADRTGLSLARQTPTLHARPQLVRPEGLEPPTYGFEARRSIQLSYGRTAVKSITLDRDLSTAFLANRIRHRRMNNRI